MGSIKPKLSRSWKHALVWASGIGILFSCLNTVKGAGSTLSSSQGHINFYKHTTSADDAYTASPTPSVVQFMNTNWPRLLTFAGYWDQYNNLSWYPNAWTYDDSIAIYSDPTNSFWANLIAQHPGWILHDTNGNPVYINWGCSGGTCPQYAANITDPNGFRAWWISSAQPYVTRSLPYKGIFVDDVNLDISRLSDGNGNTVIPVDPATGQPMTSEAWMSYFADYMAQVRAAFPGVEIVHNSLWYLDWTDSNVQREIRAADWINLERGVNDPGLTGGTGYWSLNRLLSFIDAVHANGKNVILDGEMPASDSDAAREYSVACYLLVSTGNDLVGDSSQTPSYWWNGFTPDLGAASGSRYTWNNLLRRDFAGGFALVNPPQSSTVTVTLPGSFVRVDGSVVTSVTLNGAQGAILSYLPCDVNRDGATNNLDVQAAIAQALNQSSCGTADLDKDTKCTVIDVQIVVNAAAGGACSAH